MTRLGRRPLPKLGRLAAHAPFGAGLVVDEAPHRARLRRLLDLRRGGDLEVQVVVFARVLLHLAQPVEHRDLQPDRACEEVVQEEPSGLGGRLELVVEHLRYVGDT